MLLYELLNVVNESTAVEIVDADNGEVLCEKNEAATQIALFEATFKYRGEWYSAEVMDINTWDNVITICIDVDHDEDEDDRDWDWEDEDPASLIGWAQQDMIDSYRRER